VAARAFDNIGAWILGRNMFGPVRGPWPDESWRGWWGDEPPYHVPVFVLTHHARAPFTMKGGTEFRFVTDGIESALAQAKEVTKGPYRACESSRLPWPEKMGSGQIPSMTLASIGARIS
jgi:dihydrofolate reductase